MRVVKEAEERKNEILDVAERLFCTKGFDHTSTNDILREIGIARGTLYYHFKSKEDILDAMIDRITEQVTAKASRIAMDESVPVLERITGTIMALNVDNETGHMIMEQVHRPQNALLHQKMQEKLLKKVNPLITKILEDAIGQGICDSAHPEEAVEMVMLYSNSVFDEAFGYSEEERQKKVSGFIYNTERLFGMEQGSLITAVQPLFQR